MKVGNVKKMREALEKIRDLLFLRGDGKVRCTLTWDEFNDSWLMCKNALTAKPRNCDRFANEAEAGKAFIDWYNTVYGLWGDKWNEVSSCDLKHNVDDILLRYIEWLFDTAEEKGDDK